MSKSFDFAGRADAARFGVNLVADFPRVLATLIDWSFVLVRPSTSGARDDAITVLDLALVVDAHIVGFFIASRSTRF